MSRRKREEAAALNSMLADVLETAKSVIRIEAEEIAQLEDRLGVEFLDAVEAITSCLGRGGKVIVTGVGKSGIVGKKLAATMKSMGTTAFFLHPVARTASTARTYMTRFDFMIGLPFLEYRLSPG